MIDFKLQGVEDLGWVLEDLRKKLEFDAEKMLDLAAKNAQRTAVRNVQPFGLGKKAKEAGNRAIYKDLGHAFSVVPDDARNRRGVIDSLSGAVRHHKSQRNRRGRVSRRAVKKSVIASVYYQYRSIVVQRSGLAKRSFLDGSEELGNKFSAWLKRGEREGSTVATKRRGRKVWAFSSRAHHIDSQNVFGGRGVRRVETSSGRVLRLSLQGMLRRRAKDAERRANA